MDAPRRVIKPIVNPPILRYPVISSNSLAADSFFSISKELSDVIGSLLKILNKFVE